MDADARGLESSQKVTNYWNNGNYKLFLVCVYLRLSAAKIIADYLRELTYFIGRTG